jgi:hypothetical protein
MKCFFHGVQRTGTDIAIHHAHGGDGKSRQTLTRLIGGLRHAADTRRRGQRGARVTGHQFTTGVRGGEDAGAESMPLTNVTAPEILLLGIC